MKDKTAVMCHNIAKYNRECHPMPNEMNRAEVAERLEKEATRRKELYQAAHMADDNYDFIAILHIAAADERRIANGELVEVAHAEWKASVKGKQIRRCGACGAEYFIGNGNEPKYCPSCGAKMSGMGKENA